MNIRMILRLWVLIPVLSFAQLNSTQKEQIGFTALQTRLGANIPDGKDISVTQVEAADGSGNYLPNTGDSQFTGKTFVIESGASGTSSHATTVGRYYYGSQSLAPSIGDTADGQDIGLYEANNWLGSGFLNTGNSASAPKVETRDIQNHSWVGNSGSAQEILRRIDYAISRDDFVATFGLPNDFNAAATLMGNAFNGIVVGVSDGTHRTEEANIDVSGRTIPHVVVPTSFTSWAAPTMGSAAALLIETARNDANLSDGDRHQTVKSLTMAGASRNGDNVGFTWNAPSGESLDQTYGAGQLNIENSYDILTAGKFAANGATLAGETGWDFNTADSTVDNLYFFDFNGGDLTGSLNWDRNVTDTQQGPNFSFSHQLANLDLRLYSADGFVLQSELFSSLGTTDNTEFIWGQSLTAGRYAWEVTSDTDNVDYSLAWFAVIPEPGSVILAGLALACGLVPCVRRKRKRRY